MTDDIVRMDATRISQLIARRELSPVEVMRAHLDRIAAVNPKLNAIVTLADGAMEGAERAEAAVRSGAQLGPLHGVPFTVKDGIDTAGVLTQRGSPIFRGRVPETDATVVARLKAAGAILIAKTNPPEFSYSIETDNLLTGQTNNPWNLDYTPGGSSGGESAAIAAGMSPLGVGSDLSISLRGPAAHTGIVGFKATHGRMPMTGHWPRVPRRFWHIGPMARSVRDVALAYSLMAGPDGADGFSISSPGLDTGVGTKSTRQLRVGWMASPGFFGPIDPEVVATVKAAAQALSSAGYHVEQVRLPVVEQTDANSVLWQLQQMESQPEFEKVTAGHEAEIFRHARLVLDAPDTPIADFVAAEQAIERLRDSFAEYFQRYDVLLCPVTPFPATRHGLNDVVVDGVTVSPFHVMSATSPFSLTGMPALSMRFGTSRDGLPIGVQVVSSWLAESTVLKVASLLEEVSPVRDLHPTI
ncbi:amidase [Bradyrhizobium japonicum]|uniref:amidase n=1 Tax=Bradyrhizobium japonicum TaxID=375 RepID=UPI0020A0DBDE|nr:amidase [Bradyrhizobium japonicum]MCP1760906.1 aspartyl-tRNA(Asn)/glutamyl-tRNA(Gln) amidotransferase subunit A [Bradyrhizobium japonicum]MCP1792484.1 aspartyl-tRNA(Asn)/glutamyl-tRNA(Gln) amidotransferase subunit A [Bradyrhizobium japonicum]MCP1804921.1 aspartyl-tRNA(Asn)/glutamyl-tRNA(Gln) amidotransferase subunit A [Bradyrhizobium japonicum]MCP1813938.1 aspartyl-tRNA(Asn)/glutamyl-tRNA(Gln) amidotransferase subunit A [Bradyrhizobium japonicum]MCP1874638.1 aspartyl-tRNA(Asn)/glutamyl-tRNA